MHLPCLPLSLTAPSSATDNNVATTAPIPDAEEDGVWEDEDDDDDDDDDDDTAYNADPLVTDSDLSDDADQDANDADDASQQRAAYRDAVRQYRSSRRALLLSGLSSYASSPSPEHLRRSAPQPALSPPRSDPHSHPHRPNHSASPTPQPDSVAPSPSSSFLEDRYGDSDRYLSASNAESIDAADPPGRAHDAVYRDDHDDHAAVASATASSGSPSSIVASRRGDLSPSPRSPHTDVDPHRGPPSSSSWDQREAYASEHSTPTLDEARSSTPDSTTFHEAEAEAEAGVDAGSPLLSPRSNAQAALSPATEKRGIGAGAGAVATLATSNDEDDRPHHESSGDGVSHKTSRGTLSHPAQSQPQPQPQPKRRESTSGIQALGRRSSGVDVAATAAAASGTGSSEQSVTASGAAAAAAAPGQLQRPEEPSTSASSPAITAAADAAAAAAAAPFSLWDYLQEEILATDFDSTQEMKWERVTNFIAIPFWMEKIIMFGFVVCLDSFLYTFTILPLRFAVAAYKWAANTAGWAVLGREKRYLHSSHKCDLLKALLLVLSCVILSRLTDASKMYHSVRGQDVVKLSVIFNVLEIADRLCCSFGQDLLDSLFSRITLARRKNGRQPYLRPLGFFVLSLGYVLAHTLVLFYQLVTLNVAINSYDNALLTLLLSNQFVEIKGSVFKKFEKENIFQMTCADIVERFQLTLMLTAIGLRNLIELSGGGGGGGEGGVAAASPLPASFTVFPSLSLLETVLTPLCIVLASECAVDWLKHAFITKFNHIRPAVYGRFVDVLCRDLVVGGPNQRNRKHTFVDQSPIVLDMVGDTSHIDECALPPAAGAAARNLSLVGSAASRFMSVDVDSTTVRWLDMVVRASTWTLILVIAWTFLVAVKLLLGAYLVSYASHRYATMHQREIEENLNSKDRAPIGVDKDELSYDKKLVQLVDRSDDNAIQIMLDGRHVSPSPSSAAAGGKDKKTGSLMDVSRYTMVRSRIW
ncbi:uncharacterized protein PFL1_02953 [Pseudozyma flocculosa PF-1]|uniref:Eukaryotic membrane protein family-domain-containing protein n=1 Tax=Pseudozyma flocculosa PF-1 TaxID=1277687 RepID=A0A061HAT5_9BASI|nr:uncharacterized protein PFL1_02953 [Pseudozyma flocculosa PF-1]EPQ29733.1 hypothetical protein PFL1_02953 [Pseudozyma flocculosa PF-1]